MDNNASSPYPELDQLMWGYFNEDFDIWGNTVSEIVSKYKEGITPSKNLMLIEEINKFMLDHAGDLEDAFEEAYGSQFDPEPWDHTTASFLRELKRLLQE